ncbi:hypothetical protein [uncultured Methylobacterium sp.]|uniref:hypothetical protein n=1 Tax=uncultured Methylobacterium sp. TaxID=157278 RepID=UPI0035C9AB03
MTHETWYSRCHYQMSQDCDRRATDMAVVAGYPDAVSADYAADAERAATEAGMALDEYEPVLKGEAIAAFVPRGDRESAAAYGLRAAGEILVRYLMEDA